ncbi:hypothetical protein F5I97DRAFT_1801015, partial [Phlebopus sp. FC_14]
ARAHGIGYVQELVSRLTETPIETRNSSTNATSLYVDASHEVVIMNTLIALNLSSFATAGPLPSDHIPQVRSLKTSQVAPMSNSNVSRQQA